MTKRSEEVLGAALELEQADRAAIAARLLDSISLSVVDQEVERSWTAEVERRAQRVLDRGGSGAEGDMVFERVLRSVRGA